MVDTEYDGERIPDEAKKYSWEFRVDEYRIKNNDNFMELWVIEVNSSPATRLLEDSGRDDLVLRIWHSTFVAVGLLDASVPV